VPRYEEKKGDRKMTGKIVVKNERSNELRKKQKGGEIIKLFRDGGGIPTSG